MFDVSDPAGICVGVLAIFVYGFLFWLFSGGSNDKDDFSNR